MLAIVGAVAAIQSCFLMGNCDNHVKNRVPSPDGVHVAVVFERSCGATTETSTQISIVDAADAKDVRGSGNVAVVRAQSHSSVTWADAMHLNVVLAVDSAAQVNTRKEKVNGVTIIYR